MGINTIFHSSDSQPGEAVQQCWGDEMPPIKPCPPVLLPCRLSYRLDRMTIDVVYTWTGNRPTVIEPSRYRDQPICSDALAAWRFRDRDELRYSLRSLWAFGKFVRHIYLITPRGESPSWLRRGSGITVVDDREIFPDPSHLPTRNSLAVECHLHRIGGLSEPYVYFNDDMFLGRPVMLHDFVASDGRLKLAYETAWSELPEGDVEPRDSGFIAAWRNTGRLLNRRFGPRPRRFPAHQATVQSKAIFQKMGAEELFRPWFVRTSASPVRCHSNITPGGLHFYYALHTQKAFLRSSADSFVHCLQDRPAHNRRELAKITQHRPRFFCINDDTRFQWDEIQRDLFYFLNTMFPNKSPFEV
jgi:hypothetical protein